MTPLSGCRRASAQASAKGCARFLALTGRLLDSSGLIQHLPDSSGSRLALAWFARLPSGVRLAFSAPNRRPPSARPAPTRYLARRPPGSRRANNISNCGLLRGLMVPAEQNKARGPPFPQVTDKICNTFVLQKLRRITFTAFSTANKNRRSQKSTTSTYSPRPLIGNYLPTPQYLPSTRKHGQENSPMERLASPGGR